MMTIKAIVHEEDGGYWAEVPSLPGCVTEGNTLDEIVKRLWEAVEGWTESRKEFDSEAQAVTPATHELELLIETKAVA